MSSAATIFKTKNLLFLSVFKMLFVLVFLVNAISPAFAIRPSWAGRLDKTFGDSGKVTNQFSLSDSISDIVLQPDGKIVTANTAFVNNSYDFAVSRYNSDGSIDRTFGARGSTTTDVSGFNDYASAIAIQTDGKILVGGYVSTGVFSPAVARYNSDGALDTSFGSGGKILFQEYNGQFLDVTVQPDGRILLGGFVLNQSNNQTDYFLVRLLPNGQLDAAFGMGGIVITDFGAAPPPTPTPSMRTNAALAANGGVASASSDSGSLYSPSLAIDGSRSWGKTGGWRDGTQNVFPDSLQVDFNSAKTINEIDVYTIADDFSNPADPTLADTFSLYGIVDFDVQYWNGSEWVTVPNGMIRGNNKVIRQITFSPITTTKIRILVLNALGGFSRIVEVEAYTADAPPPPTRTTNEVIRDLALQPDGKIIAVGTTDITVQQGDFAIARYNSDGQLDLSFGSGGKVRTDFAGAHDEAFAVALQPDGRFVVGGVATDGGRKSAIARYKPNGDLDASFAGGGKLTSDISFYGFIDVIVSAGNKIIAGTTRDDKFTLVRYNANGTLDPTFDFDGIVQTGFTGSSVLSSILLQPDGKLVAGGYVFNSSNRTNSNALARYNLSIAHADFDGDNRTDLSVFRPGVGVWYLQQSYLGFKAVPLGSAGDIPVAANYDGDNQYDIAVFNAGVWTVLQSLDNTVRTVRLGQAGDIPVPGDYDGDGLDDFAVFRGGVWIILFSTTNQTFGVQFGLPGDIPVPADYDHDGRIDLAVYRAGTWFLLKSTEGFAAIQFGIPSDVPIVGDFDGDGRADQTVFRDGFWYFNLSQAGTAALIFGFGTDIPLTGDFDGDDITDVAVYRKGFWYILKSFEGFSAVQFGVAGDRPIPSAKLTN